MRLKLLLQTRNEIVDNFNQVDYLEIERFLNAHEFRAIGRTDLEQIRKAIIIDAEEDVEYMRGKD